MSRVLVVEDERKLLRAWSRGLRAEGYEVVTAATGNEGSTIAAGLNPSMLWCWTGCFPVATACRFWPTCAAQAVPYLCCC